MSDHWPPHLWNRAKELLDRGFSRLEVANRVGRTVPQLDGKVRWENMTAEERKQRASRITAQRKSRAGAPSEARYNAEPKTFERAPDHVFEERSRRQAAPRTPIQEFLGEPPRGFSALDRKLRGEEEPLCLDRRAAQTRSRITLAGQS